MVYKAVWEQQYLDLAELARLYWVENWKLNKLMAHFGISKNAMKDRLRRMKSKPELIEEFAPNIENGKAAPKRSKS